MNLGVESGYLVRGFDASRLVDGVNHNDGVTCWGSDRRWSLGHGVTSHNDESQSALVHTMKQVGKIRGLALVRVSYARNSMVKSGSCWP